MTMTESASKNIDVRSPDLSKLDTPYPGREFRLYIAVTNRCNRSCPFCSVYASIKGKMFIKIEQILPHLPSSGHYQVQLEGGEPFLHPDLFKFVQHFTADPRCTRIIVSTNGSLFPFVIEQGSLDRDATRVSLQVFFSRFPSKVTFKVSLNYHLLAEDPLLFEKARTLLDYSQGTGVDIIFNLRKRNDPTCDFDAHLEHLVDQHGLRGFTNSFYLQRYGRNFNDANAEPPFIVGTNWCAINPDGSSWGIDLAARSEGMRRLP
jgi:hypothetical protein